MNHVELTKSLFLAILCLVAYISPVIAAEKLRSYSNQEFGFSFQYPESWATIPANVPNLRVKVAAPAHAQVAECMIVVKRYPKAATAKQSDIDQVFAATPTIAELKESLSQGSNDVDVITASSTTLHSRPAHLARVRYNTNTALGPASASGRVVMTASPGLTWTVTCVGQGDTPAKAEESYQFWKKEIDRLITSFKFN